MNLDGLGLYPLMKVSLQSVSCATKPRSIYPRGRMALVVLNHSSPLQLHLQ